MHTSYTHDPDPWCLCRIQLSSAQATKTCASVSLPAHLWLSSMTRMAGVQVSLLPSKGGLRGERVVVGVAVVGGLLGGGHTSSRRPGRAVPIRLVLRGLAVLTLLVCKAAHALRRPIASIALTCRQRGSGGHTLAHLVLGALSQTWCGCLSEAKDEVQGAFQDAKHRLIQGSCKQTSKAISMPTRSVWYDQATCLS